nr:RtcB family protein [Ardenticatenia bacterium]
MVDSGDLNQMGEYVYEIPQSFREDMRVPARFYADAELLTGALGDKSLEQLVNTATLPGVARYALAMPDIHQGYGFPIGGVVATELPDGIISPGGVGYDINCGVRLLATHLEEAEVAPHLDDLASALYANCPSGVGKGGSINLRPGELDRILEKGANWALGRAYATES